MYKMLSLYSAIVFIMACRPVSESYEPLQNAVTYTAKALKNNPPPTSDIKLMSWNIRFGIGRNDWFGDACGVNTSFPKSEIESNMNKITQKINAVDPDILLVQECDVNSKRSSYTNQINIILDNTKFNYAYYGPMWQSQFIPSHGLGKMDMGIVIFSKWPLDNVTRINLPTRTDQSAAEKYFYLNYCMLKADLNIAGFKPLTVFNLHAVAFATDDTKKWQFKKVIDELDAISNIGGYFVCGGDFNTLPPIAGIKTDFCLEDICSGEKYHQAGADPEHKAGSNYSGESEFSFQLFEKYNSSLPLSKYILNESAYFTHTTRHPDNATDRRLDYFFTNHLWVNGTDTTFQDGILFSDHVPISVNLKLPF
jgi:endonuclease/exonuclease/phosphatase family metal-dependent hydrolase